MRFVLQTLGLVVALIFVQAFLAAAAEKGDTGLVESMQKQYRSIESFRADFVQELTNAASGDQETRNGTIAFMKPQYIRWQTEKPEKEVLVVSEETVWNFIPVEKVAYRYTLKEKFRSKTMLEFISGRVSLEEDFQVIDQGADAKHNGWTKIKLVPKEPEPNLVLAYVWIEPDSLRLRQILLVDFWGNGNQLTFDNIEYGVALSEEDFSFEPPEGVQVMTNPHSSRP